MRPEILSWSFFVLLAAASPMLAPAINDNLHLTARAASPLSCPAANGTTFVASNQSYTVECSIDRSGNDLTYTGTPTLDACIGLCATTSSCVDVSWISTNNLCYLKSAVGVASYPGAQVWGARLSSISPPTSQLSCPASNGTTYTTPSGTRATVECYVNHYGGDQILIGAASLDSCIGSCASTAGCLAVAWLPSNTYCYLKNVTEPGSANQNVWSATILAAPAAAPAPNAAATTKSSSTLATSITTSQPTTTLKSASSAVPTASTSAKPLTTTTAASSRYSSSTSSATPNPSPVCPGSHGSSYATGSGVSFLIECSTDRTNGDTSSVVTTSGLDTCMQACASTTGCLDVTYFPAPAACHLQTVLNNPSNNGTAMGARRINANASYSPNPTAFAAKQWSGMAGIKYWFGFGDSYTADGFLLTGTQPVAGNPIGNPPPPYAILSDGPDYLIDLTQSAKNGPHPFLMYDLAYNGAMVGSGTVLGGNDTNFGAPSAVVQVATEWYENYVDTPAVPWNASNSIFSFFFGINDNDAIVQNGVTDNATAVADQNADLATYRSMLEFVYKQGGRNFLVINCPPVERTPLWLVSANDTQRAELGALVRSWNNGLQSMISSMQQAHPDVTMFYYDVWTTMGAVITNPAVRAQTAQYNNTNGWCAAYFYGTGGNTTYCDSSCSFGCVNNYMFGDWLHPTWPFHQVMAAEITTLLG